MSDVNGKRADKKSANKFLLACILNYRIRAETAWVNARRLAEEIFGDPADLWEQITACTQAEWNAKWREYRLHRFPKAHERVWRIGNDIVSQYGGNARKIWSRQSPPVVLERLLRLRVGPQIARMIVGALMDTEQISGYGDVKADIHVTRVLGRLLLGRPLSPGEATELTRQMHPENPWELDGPLYWLGKETCFARDPACDECAMQRACCFGGG